MSLSEQRRRTGWLPAICQFEDEALLHEKARHSNVSIGQSCWPSRRSDYQIINDMVQEESLPTSPEQPIAYTSARL